MDEQRSQLGQAIKTKEIYEVLTRTEAWKSIVIFIDAQIEARRCQIEGRHATGIEDILQTEGLKGEIRSLKFIKNLPEQQLEEAKVVVNAHKEKTDA